MSSCMDLAPALVLKKFGNCVGVVWEESSDVLAEGQEVCSEEGAGSFWSVVLEWSARWSSEWPWGGLGCGPRVVLKWSSGSLFSECASESVGCSEF